MPPGTPLEIRLTSSVASFSSKVGDSVSAVLIAPVVRNGREILPQGVEFTGIVRKVSRVGYGVRHETASIRLDFNRLRFSDGATLPVASRVIEVDTGREKVNSSGVIQGIRSTGSISYRVSGYVRTALLWDVHAELAEWAIKSLLVELPEPEIYYPAGTELKIGLTRQLTFAAECDPDPETEAGDDLDGLRTLIASMPVRTQDPNNKRPSDLTNLLLIGSREDITTAFRAAGWSEAGPASMRNRIECIRAAAEIHGFHGAPMTNLLLDGSEADMSWQKSLNDVSKRHHIRIWKQPDTWNGQELWMAAATRDVDFAYLRPGKTFTHEIDPKVDNERDKVANDLEFTTCARPVVWAERQGTPRFTHNGTGDPIATDTRLAVMELNACPSPRLATEDDSSQTLAAHGTRLQRFLRREILVTRSDFIRSNVYYRSFEAARWAVRYLRYRQRKASEMRSLEADYGPGGSSPPAAPRNSVLATLRGKPVAAGSF